MKALSRDVADRYATAQEMGDALEKAARALECVGSVRDVSNCLEEVMGVDLSQQRDVVRSWLARSEPSKGGSGPRARPVLDSIVTRVEGGPTSEPSKGPGSRAPLSGPVSAPPEKVSSVSSAVIQVPDAFAPAGPASIGVTQPAPSRSSRAAIVLVAIVVLVGVGAWGAKTYRRGSASAIAPAATATAATGAAPGAVEPAAPETTKNAAEATTPSAPATTAAAAASEPPAPSATAPRPLAGAGGVGRGGRGAGRPVGSARTPVTPPPPPPGTTTAPPDDLSHNPYR